MSNSSPIAFYGCDISYKFLTTNHYLPLQSRAILERHLVIADQVYTMKDLVAMSRDTESIRLPTFRDTLKIRVEEEAGRKYLEKIPLNCLYNIIARDLQSKFLLQRAND